MNRTLQPLALIIGVGVLVALRLVAGQDVFSEFVNDLLRNGHTPAAQEDTARIQALENRVQSLERELDFRRSSRFDLAAANIVNKTSASFRQLVKIDRGIEDGVDAGRPVLANGYLIGLVSEASAKSATVLLLGDPDLNIPVMTDGADGIATAKAGGLVVSELNDDGQARSGQAVITSGLGGLYPPGLAVGQLGARLSEDILGEFVLSRPFNLSEINVVQVILP